MAPYSWVPGTEAKGLGKALPMQMDIDQIMALLPHRYPFLLVDRVLEIEQGSYGKALCPVPAFSLFISQCELTNISSFHSPVVVLSLFFFFFFSHPIAVQSHLWRRCFPADSFFDACSLASLQLTGLLW